MEKFVKYNKLFDCYEMLLTDKEKSSFKDYYEEDLSLQEIAENNNVSRSAIHKTIKNVEEKLDFYESNLKLCYLLDELKKAMNDDEKNIKNKLEQLLKDFE